MGTLVHQMNHILAEWKNQFDVFSAVQLEFSMNEAGEMCLNGLKLPFEDGLFLENASTGPKMIKFHFSGSRCLLVGISWPEDGTPCLQYVYFGYANIPTL